MHLLSFILAALLDVQGHVPNVRGHIPNQPSFGTGPARAAYGVLAIRAVAAFFITAALLSAALWLAVRLAMVLL